MSPCRILGLVSTLWLILLGTSPAHAAADPAAAERQYRIARRLVAEGSAQAAEALRRVAELDPDGALADDVLLDLARLEGLPEWAEQIGTLDPRSASRSLALLDRLLKKHPGGDRTVEARYYRGLTLLQPYVGRDPSRARVDLLTVATEISPGPWGPRARLALAWIYESEGRHDAAYDAFQRLRIDAPGSQAALRAQVASGRLLLRSGKPSEAAILLQQTLERGVGSELHAAELRELAVRSVVEARSGSGPADAVVLADTGLRTENGFGATPDGGLVGGDRRGERVREFDAAGLPRGEYSISDLECVAVDRTGRIFAAAAGKILRLVPGGPWVPVAASGDYAPVSTMTADRFGGLWVVDRRGQRIGRVSAGDSEPTPIFGSSDSRIVSIAWDGRKLLALDAKRKQLLAFDSAGRAETVALEDLEKPVSMACDPSGRVGILDSRTRRLHLRDAGDSNFVVRSYDPETMRKPVALSLGLDGAVHLFDGATGLWGRWP